MADAVRIKIALLNRTIDRLNELSENLKEDFIYSRLSDSVTQDQMVSLSVVVSTINEAIKTGQSF